MTNQEVDDLIAKLESEYGQNDKHLSKLMEEYQRKVKLNKNESLPEEPWQRELMAVRLGGRMF